MNEIKEALIAIDKRNKKGRGIIGGFLLFIAISVIFSNIPEIIIYKTISMFNIFPSIIIATIFSLFAITFLKADKEYSEALKNDEYTTEFVICESKSKKRTGSRKNRRTSYHVKAQVDGVLKDSTVSFSAYNNVNEGDHLLAVKYGKNKVKLFTEYQLNNIK